MNQEVVLAGPGADAQVNGVMFTTGRQHLAYFTRQDHVAHHTTSDLLYKGGLKGRSRVVWKGMIRVEKDAQRTDAYQKNDNLVLSESARADSIPGLEIEANDVRCTHGATAGRVDEDMIFYAAGPRHPPRDRRPPDRRGLLRQRLRPDHARAGPRDAPAGRRGQAGLIPNGRSKIPDSGYPPRVPGSLVSRPHHPGSAIEPWKPEIGRPP